MNNFKEMLAEIPIDAYSGWLFPSERLEEMEGTWYSSHLRMLNLGYRDREYLTVVLAARANRKYSSGRESIPELTGLVGELNDLLEKNGSKYVLGDADEEWHESGASALKDAFWYLKDNGEEEVSVVGLFMQAYLMSYARSVAYEWIRGVSGGHLDSSFIASEFGVKRQQTVLLEMVEVLFERENARLADRVVDLSY